MDVENEVRQIIAKSLNMSPDELTDDTNLQDIGAESLDIIEVIFQIEEKFDIEMTVKMGAEAEAPEGRADAPSLADFSTIGDICKAVRAIVEAKAG